MKVVKDYLEGTSSYQRLVKKYGMKSSQQIKNWVKNYKTYGLEGLKRKTHHPIYTVHYKLDVLNFMKRTGASVADTALQFGLTNPSMVAAWKKAFMNGGAEALKRQKGRAPMSDHAKKKTKKSSEEDRGDQHTLERENELLRLEVAYLKKLHAFQMDPEGSLEKHKQRYHSNSKKGSD